MTESELNFTKSLFAESESARKELERQLERAEGRIDQLKRLCLRMAHGRKEARAEARALRDALEEIRMTSRTYRRWTTNKFDGEREMVGCNYCPASAEGQMPINHHRMCALNLDREKAFQEEREKRGWSAALASQPSPGQSGRAERGEE